MFTLKTKWSEDKDCYFTEQRGNLQVWSESEGPICQVNAFPIEGDVIFIKNYSENEGLVEALQKLGLIGSPITCKVSGFECIEGFKYNREKFLAI